MTTRKMSSSEGNPPRFDNTTHFPIAMICCDRPDYLQRSLDSLLCVEGIESSEILLFQDGSNAAVDRICGDFVARLGPGRARHFRHPHPKAGLIPISHSGAYYIAAHYRYVLQTVFEGPRHHGAAEGVILVEDDMIFAPDFLSFFQQTAPLLAADDELWCVSSWNDNGFRNMAADPRALYRTDFFIGLGQPRIRKGRQCLFPRCLGSHYNIGSRGTHLSQALWSSRFEGIRMYEGPPVTLALDPVRSRPAYRGWLEAQLARPDLVVAMKRPPGAAARLVVELPRPGALCGLLLHQHGDLRPLVDAAASSPWDGSVPEGERSPPEAGPVRVVVVPFLMTSPSVRLHAHAPPVVPPSCLHVPPRASIVPPSCLHRAASIVLPSDEARFGALAGYLGLWEQPARGAFEGLWVVPWGPRTRLLLVASWSPLAGSLATPAGATEGLLLDPTGLLPDPPCALKDWPPLATVKVRPPAARPVPLAPLKAHPPANLTITAQAPPKYHHPSICERGQ
ncbi:putative GNT-I family protein [Paratrimastix pyriformis]|uniref:alpha-1,3-mannosyl-glycoprotein 2-beta-N-acetylglucosaminyltransferase n=1 Tax=Paratrimastix pyriformis TaxID=342808 RepID=A0ABQ8UJN4_9EUKA|nr:putative GNT-I family protein [Paratrimastix pyriformis]